MAFNVKEFKNNLSVYGHLKQSSFDVEIQIPSILQHSAIIDPGGSKTPIRNITKMMTLRSKHFSGVPVIIKTKPSRIYGIGPDQQMPFSADWNKASFTFIGDKKGWIWSFWYNWINTIFHFAGNYDAPGGYFKPFTRASYQASYRSDYASTIIVRTYDPEGRLVLTTNLLEAFPVSMNENKVSWDSKNAAVDIGIQVSFREFTISKTTLGPDQSASIRDNIQNSAFPFIRN